jgi:hypothetical protein
MRLFHGAARQRRASTRFAAPTTQVHDALAEKRAVAAIVLDHEEAHEKAGGWHGKQLGNACDRAS